jgi:predicted nucleic acid-binding protein
MVTTRRALADTSIFIGFEAERFDADKFADFEWGISAVTLGELRLGVLQAKDPETSSRRLSTYQLAQRFEAMTIDESVSDAWALLVSRLRAAGRKMPINDSWIAATAIAHDIPLVTQDADYDDLPDVEVIRIPGRPRAGSVAPTPASRPGAASEGSTVT